MTSMIFSLHRHHHGFTLIELMVVIAIVSTLAIPSIVGYVQYNTVQSQHTAAQDVKSFVELAEARAISHAKPDLCGFNTLSGYQFVIVDVTHYEVDAVCGSPPYPSINTGTMPHGVTISGTSPLTFVPLSTTFPSGTVKVSASGLPDITITAFSTGVIQMQ